MENCWSSVDIPSSKFAVLNKIGDGAQGAVYLVEEKSTAKKVALKVLQIKADVSDRPDEMFASLKNEFSILHKLRHTNVVSVIDFGFSDDNKSCYYTMEHLNGVNLSEFLKYKNNEQSFIEMAYQSLCGLAYLHSNQVMHYDIKPENIIVCTENDKQVLKILDFGLSDFKIKSGSIKARGSLNYMAPEFFIAGSSINEKADIYSLGVTLLSAYVSTSSASDLSLSMSASQIIEHINGRYISLEKQLMCLASYRIKKFLNSLIQQNPGLRTSSALEALRSLNYIFNTTYEIPDMAVVQKFADNSTFLLRNNQYKNINSFSHETLSPENSKSVVFIEGADGSGKTKLLEHFYYSEVLSGRKIFKINESEKQTIKFYIIKKFCTMLYEEMPSKFRDFLPEIENFENLSVDELSDLLDSQLNTRLGNNSLFVILDDVENYDLASVEVLCRLILKGKFYYLTILLAYNLDKLDSSFQLSFNFIKNQVRNLVIPLEPLSFEEILKIKKTFIGDVFHEPSDFVDSIYTVTQGNFLKVMQFFDWLFELKIIRRMQNVFIFEDERLFRELLNRDLGNLNKARIDELRSFERDILAIFVYCFEPVSNKNNLFFSTGNPESEIINIINGLENKGILRRNNGPVVQLQIFSSEFRKYLIANFFSREELKKALLTLKSANGQLVLDDNNNTLISLLCNYLNEESSVFENSSIELFFNKLDELYNKIPLWQQEIFYLTVNKIAEPESAFELLTILSLTDFYYSQNNEKDSRSWHAKATVHCKLAANPRLLAKFGVLKIRIFKEANANEEVCSFIEKNYPCMREYTDRDKLFRILIAEAYNTININKDRGKFIYDFIKKKLSAENEIDPRYVYMIDIVEYLYNFKTLDSTSWETLSKRLIYMTSQKPLTEIDGGYLRFYIELALKNSHSNQNELIEQVLTDLSNSSDSIGQTELMAGIYNIASVFFYNNKEFEKAYSFISKQYNLVKKMSSGKSNSLLGNMATIKLSLYHNINETMEVFEQGMFFFQQYGPLRNFVLNSLNYALCCFKAGKFSDGKKLVFRGLQDCTFAIYQNLLSSLDNLNYYMGYLLDENEYQQIIDQAYEKKLITDENKTRMISKMKGMYEHITSGKADESNNDYQLNGELKFATPFLIVKYLKENKCLPQAETVFKVGYKPASKSSTGDYLLHLIVSYMMNQSSVSLMGINDFFKKLEISGYQFRLYELVVPFVEYLFCTKEDLGSIKRFLILQRSGEQFLIDNMDEVQKSNFVKTCLYRNALKNLKRMKNGYEKMKSEDTV